MFSAFLQQDALLKQPAGSYKKCMDSLELLLCYYILNMMEVLNMNYGKIGQKFGLCVCVFFSLALNTCHTIF